MTSLEQRHAVDAIEPIVCAGSPRAITARDGWTVRTADGKLAHHEHTLVITRDRPLVLTAA
jgi:methionyl aminopeptidase